LTGLIAYIAANTDLLGLASCLLVVEKPGRVSLVGSLEGQDRDFLRSYYAVASYADSNQWKTFLAPEEFIVQLQANFLPTPDREALLRLLGTIREGAIRETVDDGIKQEVKTQKGITLVNMTTVPNPVTLQPFRTFNEIEQPTSQFVVRMRSDSADGKPKVALFEAEGGAWERVAISRIRNYLHDELGVLQPGPKPSIVA
jgi:hypothetical protein